MLTLNEVRSVFPNLRDAALLLLLQNPGWTPRQMRQYRKIDRALADVLYTVYAEMYTARWFNYPETRSEQGPGKGLTPPGTKHLKAGIMDGALTPTGRLVANGLVGEVSLGKPFSPTKYGYYTNVFKFGEKKESEYAPGVPVRKVQRARNAGVPRVEKAVPSYPPLAGHDRYPRASCFCRACKDHRAEASRLNQLGLGEQPNVPAAEARKLGGAEGNRTDVGSPANGQPRTWTDVGVLVNGKRFDRPMVQGAGKSEPNPGAGQVSQPGFQFEPFAEHIDKGKLMREHVNQLVLDWARWHNVSPLLTIARESLVKEIVHLMAGQIQQELASTYFIVAQARAKLAATSKFGELEPLAKLEFALAEREETYKVIARG